MNWDYIAGFFDGEGCIAIVRPKKGRFGSYEATSRAHARINIAQKNREVMEVMSSFLRQNGVYCSIATNKRGVHYLYINRLMSVKKFLKKINTKVIVKKSKVKEALQLNYEKGKAYLSPDQVNQIIDLKRKGYGSRKIAEIMGVNRKTVQRLALLRSRGVY